jgi:hypothetical protein
MVLALLFDEGDQLVAAAPGCDQQPLGDRYWHEIYPQSLSGRLGETALIDIKQRELAELLLTLAKDPGLLPACRQRFEAYEKQQAVQRSQRGFAA